MWILMQSGFGIYNSDQIESLGIRDNKLLANDQLLLGEYSTEDEAKKELKQIYDALIAGQVAYSVD